MTSISPTGATFGASGSLCDGETGACELPPEPAALPPGAAGEPSGSDAVRVFCVTDPLCSGCWALEPAWRRLLYRFGNAVSVTHVYGGLLPSWEGFRDRSAGITAPADVAPHWDHVSTVSGQPIDSSVWLVDPPASSFPACAAAVAVRLVAPEQEGRYLRRLRELVFLERRNIARQEVLDMALGRIEIDLDAWRTVIADGRAERAFEADRALARTLGAHVFPTLLTATESRPLRPIAQGSVGAAQLEAALLAESPLEPQRGVPSAAAALDAYGSGTTLEFAALLEVLPAEAERRLAAVGARSTPVGGGRTWER